MQSSTSTRRWPLTESGLAAAVFIYLTIVRTWGISKNFSLLGEQIRDWTIALGSWRDLPLTGTPSTVGGTSLGPIYYWILWIIRHAIGPWTGNLPHAGGIGLSIIQSAADAFLLIAIWKKTGLPWLALAVTLLVATEPLDMTLTATIWNPPVAVAFVKMTVGLILLAGDRPSMLWVLATTITAWFAVQAHSSAIFVAVPAIASFPIVEWLARRRITAIHQARAAVEVIVLLQVPFVVNLLRHPSEHAGPTTVIQSIAFSISHPAAMRFGEGLHNITNAWRSVLVGPWLIRWFVPWIVLSVMITAVGFRRDLSLNCVTTVPLICTVGGFALWQGRFEDYWFLTLMPSVALTLGLALTAWRPAARITTMALSLTAILMQPSRVTTAMQIGRLPEYAALVRGSHEIKRRTSEIRHIDAQFPLPPSTDPEFLFKVLGGRVTENGELVATIGPTGLVTFAAATR